MATGASTYANIPSTLTNDLIGGSFLTLRETNVLVPTVTVFSDSIGIDPRRVGEYGAGNLRQVAEGEDVTPTQFDKSLLSTLTPAIYADVFLLTDQNLKTNLDALRSEASMEMGGGVAENIDTNIASNFTSLTGGTVGAYLGTVTWTQIAAAAMILRQRKVRPPFFCALAPGQMYHLINNGGTVTSAFSIAQNFNDRLVESGALYLQTPVMAGVTFVVTPNLSGAGGGSCVGAMYSPRALAYDEREPFTIEYERDASRRAWEANYHITYAHGTWRPVTGVQIRSTDVIPTS